MEPDNALLTNDQANKREAWSLTVTVMRLGASCVLCLFVGHVLPHIARAEIIAEPKRISNQFGMEFVEVPSGEFIMGSRKGSSDAEPHKVRITRPFYLGDRLTAWPGRKGESSRLTSLARTSVPRH